MSVVSGQPPQNNEKKNEKKEKQKKNANPRYKATKHIERTFLISYYN